MDQKTHTIKMLLFPKLINRFYTIPLKIYIILVEVNMWILKFI